MLYCKNKVTYLHIQINTFFYYLIYVVSDMPVCAVLNSGNGEYKVERWKSENCTIHP